MSGDLIHRTAYIARKGNGFEWFVEPSFRNTFSTRLNEQIADLVVSPIGRFILTKETQEDFRIIESKLRRSSKGDYWGTGLVVLPKEKSQDPLRSSQLLD